MYSEGTESPLQFPELHAFRACVFDGRLYPCGLSHGYVLVLPCLELSSARRSSAGRGTAPAAPARCVGWSLLRNLGDLERHGLLGLVRVVGPRVHLELA